MTRIMAAFITPLPPLTTFSKALFLQPRRPRIHRHGHISIDRITIARCVTHAQEQHPNSDTPLPTPIPQTQRRFTKHLTLVITLLTLSLLPLLKTPLAYISTLSATLPIPQATLLTAITNFFTVLFCFPANMALMIAAGAILGPLPAFLALFSSKLLAAITAFLLARKLFIKRVKSFLVTKPRLSKLLTTGTDWKFVVLMRLSPFPGFMLNYLLAITDVSFLHYALGTLVGTLPSILNLVLVGDAARDISMGIGGIGIRGGWFGLAIRLVCIISMVFVTVLITRKVRHVFREFEDQAEIAEA